MLRRMILVPVFILLAFGLVGCGGSQSDSAEVDIEQDTQIDGPAFVLFFTDP